MTSQVAGGFKAFRVTGTHDPVPRVPFAVMGYAHFEPEYFLSANADPPSPSDVQLIHQPSRKQGVESQWTFSIAAHGKYFSGAISACYQQGPKEQQFSSLTDSFVSEDFQKTPSKHRKRAVAQIPVLGADGVPTSWVPYINDGNGLAAAGVGEMREMDVGPRWTSDPEDVPVW